MKLNHILPLGALCALCVAGLSSCDDDKFEGEMFYTRLDQFTDFNDDGYWAACYDMSSNAGVIIDGVHFTHRATVSEYDGVKYYSWNGFCPSSVFDLTDYSAEGTWLDHQWAAMESSEWHSGHKNYIIGDCDVTEPAHPETLTGDEDCVISLADGQAFIPLTASISNSTYAYFVMLNGSAFSRPFTSEDYLRLIITGFLDGQKTGETRVDLAADNVYLTNFKQIDLATCGALVDRLVFTMEGSDSGQWGLNTPAYFALGTFSYALDK